VNLARPPLACSARGVKAVLPALALVLLASSAHAADAGDDVDALLRSLHGDATALTTTDCAQACQALGSMRRATDRICAIDPGARCEDARKTLDDAARRVRDACPECVVATRPESPGTAVKPTVERREPAPAPPPREGSEVATAQAEKGRGGCASCSASSREEGAPVWSALAAAAWLLARSRRKRR